VRAPLLFLTSVGLLLGACRSEDPVAPGRLDRPSGLAVLERPAEDEQREDLLIVDSESEGVKVVQYDGSRINFIAAPNAFFPLVIQTPGFPTEIVPSPHGADQVDLAYVLSPGSSQLHLIDVTPLGFGDSVLSKAGNQRIGTLELDTPGLIPTDIAVFASGELDVVAISFDGIAADDQLMLVRMDAATRTAIESATSELPARIEDLASATTTIAAQPRGIAVRGAGTDAVSILSSSGSSVVTEVAIDPVAATILGTRDISTGGPTSDIVDAGDQGAFAIRSDRPRVVHLIPGANGLERSTVIDDSPYTPITERGTEEVRGTLDVFPSPIGAAVLGRFPSFADPVPRLTVLTFTGTNELRISGERTFQRSDGTPIPVLLLAHVDGTLSFIVVEETAAEIATSLDAAVLRVTRSNRMNVEVVDPDNGDTVIGTCEAVSCEVPDPLNGVPVCPESVIRYARPFFGKYRATFRGALAASQSPEFTRTSTTYLITDPTIASFEERLVQVNDLVLTQVQSQNCDNPEQPIDLIATGTITRVQGGVIEVAYGPEFDFVQACEGEESLPPITRRYEIYPGAEEMVLARLVGENVVAVVSRAPVVTSTSGTSAVFRDDPENRPLDLAIRTSSTAPFTCTEGSALCAADIDCGVARECTAGVQTCQGTCATMCAEAESTCLDRLVGRRCTYAEFEVVPTVPFAVPTAQLVGNTTFPSAAPTSAVFSPRRSTWVISFPGSRVLVEMAVVSDDPATTENEADFGIFHIR
jgi:hypothetical protein